MSKSTTQVLCPRDARPEAKEAAEVVFPTPPLPDVMQIMRPRVGLGPSTLEGWDRTKSSEEDENCLALFCGCWDT